MANVFVTGGAGFLGRHILREARTRHPDWRWTIYSRDEGKHAKARMDHPDARYILGTVQDLDHLTTAMMGHDLVIHAAALKYVPQAEAHVSETVRVNVEGSRHVATAAMRARVKHVVGISTDKACRPTSVYGLTKRLMERMFQEADGVTDTQFNCVRYGNVIGSTGSVIPIFQDLARGQQRLTVTDMTMSRFWLSVAEAVDLIFKALRIPGEFGGVTLVPRLGATDMETLVTAAAQSVSVHNPKVSIVGRRPGEKRDEDLLAPEEVPWTDARGRARVMWLHPPTGDPLPEEDRPQGLYTSATPDHWIGVDEMIRMIRESTAA